MYLANPCSLDRTRRVNSDTFYGVEWQEDLLSEFGIRRRASLEQMRVAVEVGCNSVINHPVE
jgi:hypothetical protein